MLAMGYDRGRDGRRAHPRSVAFAIRSRAAPIGTGGRMRRRSVLFAMELTGTRACQATRLRTLTAGLRSFCAGKFVRITGFMRSSPTFRCNFSLRFRVHGGKSAVAGFTSTLAATGSATAGISAAARTAI